jgi:hypothetical protein
MTQTDIVGSIGVTILLIAFLLNLTNKVQKDSILYLILNCIGAAIACLASILMHYIPFIILEGCWAMVSAYGIFYYYRNK